MANRLIFFGDVHGCLDELRELTALVAPQPGDRVICVGDFMDRGPDPAGCVRFARESGFESVAGNHEEKHVRWRMRENQARAGGPKNKVGLAEQAVKQNLELSDEDLAWMGKLPLMIMPFPWLVVVHGGMVPGVAIADAHKRRDEFMRLRFIDSMGRMARTDFARPDAAPEGAWHWSETYSGKESVIYGHEPHSLKTPRVRLHRSTGASTYGIDTGCVHGGRLTAMVLPTDATQGMPPNFFHVQAKREYKAPHWPIVD